MQPTVFFVDGPSGVGKDYFISNLAKYARTKGVHPLIHNAKEYIPAQVAQKHYNPLTSDRATINLIFSGHKALLTRVFKDIAERGADFVIVNRSFSSFILHNLHSLDNEEREEYIQEYNSFFLNRLTDEGIESYYIGLKPRYEDVDMVELFTKEILKRDGKAIDKEFVKRQLDFHLVENNLYTGIYDHAIELTSSDFKLAFYEAFGR